MALIPLFLTLIAAAGVWLVRNRTIRTQWGLSVAMALLGWLTILGLGIGPDLRLQLSVWQPAQLFRSPLSLSIDQITWPIIYSIATILLAMVLTSASREPTPTRQVRVFWFIYTGAAYLAVLAGNLLTIIITWTLFDFVSAIFLFSLLREEDQLREVITRLSIDFLGILLVLAGTAFILAVGDAAELDRPITSSLGIILIALGGFVRLGLLPLHFNLPGLLIARRGLGTLLRYYPPAIILTLLAKLFRAGVPHETVPLFLAAGLSGLVIGGIRWMLETDAVKGRPFYILVMSGVGVLATSSYPTSYTGMVAAAVVLLLAGAVISLTEIFTPSHRVYAIGATLIHLGIPLLPAGVMLAIAASHITEIWPGALWTVLILIGTAMATLGSMHSYFADEIPWRTGESLVRVSYGLGLALPILSSVGIGIQLGTELSLTHWIMAGIQLAIVLGGYFVLRNLTEGSIRRLRINLTRFDPSGFYAFIGRLLGRITTNLRAVADLIEGEAAILWLFAIAVFLVLATL